MKPDLQVSPTFQRESKQASCQDPPPPQHAGEERGLATVTQPREGQEHHTSQPGRVGTLRGQAGLPAPQQLARGTDSQNPRSPEALLMT